MTHAPTGGESGGRLIGTPLARAPVPPRPWRVEEAGGGAFHRARPGATPRSGARLSTMAALPHRKTRAETGGRKVIAAGRAAFPSSEPIPLQDVVRPGTP